MHESRSASVPQRYRSILRDAAVLVSSFRHFDFSDETLTEQRRGVDSSLCIFHLEWGWVVRGGEGCLALIGGLGLTWRACGMFGINYNLNPGVQHCAWAVYLGGGCVASCCDLLWFSWVGEWLANQCDSFG